MLLLTFPELKSPTGEVFDRLRCLSDDPAVFEVWQGFVNQEIESSDEDEDW